MGVILVLDDDAAFRFAVTEPLRRRGFEVREAGDTEEGLRIALDLRPDLIISDVWMDGGDGLTFLKDVRSHPEIATTPFIVMTGHPDAEGMLRGAEFSADGYLPKPFPITTLLATVEGRLGREAALRRNADEVKGQLQLILQASPDLIGILDPASLDFLFLNAAGRKMLGLADGAEVNRFGLSTVHPAAAFAALQREAIPTALNRGTWTGENLLLKAGGGTVPVKQSIQAHRGAKGAIAFLSTIAHDLSDQKRVETALRESEGKFRSLINSLPDAVFLHTSAGAILFSNARASALFGFSADEFREQSIFSLCVAGEVSCKMGLSAIKTQTERMCVRKNGEKMPAEVLTSDFELNGEQVQLTIVHDLTARKRLERERDHIELQLRQALKLESIGQLAAGIAHEINTPTQYIGYNTRFLQDSFGSVARLLPSYQKLLTAARHGKVNPALVQEIEQTSEEADIDYIVKEIPLAIQQSLEGVERVSSIVRAMKDFSHPGVTEKTMVDINHSIESTLTVARNEWKYVAELESRLDPLLPQVPCIPGEFNQVILNLIINAAHAIQETLGNDSSRKGKIGVGTSRQGDWAEIRISDSGTGVPEHIRSRIFEPFFTTKEVGRGTGQGLAIARSVIVEKHGGTIDFETEMGRGTTFVIRMPLHDLSAAA